MRSSFGIYFGPQVISIVQTKGKKVLNHLQVSRIEASAAGWEEKVPDEVKLVALIKEELRNNKLEVKEAAVAFSGKDLIIRTFEMPLMPAQELETAVNFEAKKYIPFKVEELVSDFQLRLDRARRRNLVLFVGIKKETLDKYLSILNQLNIKPRTIEYSAFSILRLLKLAGVSDKMITAVLGVDLQEEGEVNFSVLEQGFPLFSRDITLSSGPEEVAQTKEIESGATLEKLKTEIRISLDYYHRKFPHQAIKKILFFLSEDYRTDLEEFIKDVGLAAEFIDLTKYIGKGLPFSLTFLKGYSCSLSGVIKTAFKVNLLAAQAKLKAVKERVAEEEAATLLATLKAGLKIDPRIVILGVLICILAFIPGFYQRLSLEKAIQGITQMRLKVARVSPAASYQELTTLDAEYKEKIKTIDELIKQQLFLTEYLNLIPRLIPEGVWLTNFSFQADNGELTLQGIAYQAEGEQGLELINTFLAHLKENSQFNQYFKDINIVSLDRGKIRETEITNFLISCRK